MQQFFLFLILNLTLSLWIHFGLLSSQMFPMTNGFRMSQDNYFKKIHYNFSPFFYFFLSCIPFLFVLFCFVLSLYCVWGRGFSILCYLVTMKANCLWTGYQGTRNELYIALDIIYGEIQIHVNMTYPRQLESCEYWYILFKATSNISVLGLMWR